MEEVFYFGVMKIPQFLKEGDRVAIVATAKRLERDISEGIGTLEKWGLKVKVGKNVHNQHGYFAGSDEERIHDVQNALDDPSIKAIVFARGGYGTTRILDRIDFTSYLGQPKWIVGFSDLTSILLLSSVLEVPSVHGPVALTIGRDEVSDNQLKDLLFGKLDLDIPLLESVNTKEGSCSGRIVGGNLSLVYESMGASNEIETDGNILFLEEVGEDMYALDRMMNKLKRSGKLEDLSGAIIGSFTDISDSQSYFKESVEELLLKYLEDLDIPVAFGLEAGHEKRNYPLILGMNCEVLFSKNQISIKYII